MFGTRFSVVGLVITLLAFLVAIDLHEFSHALVARTQGDQTATQLGRLSLNPLRHLDPMGTVLLLIMVLAGFGIGWGKPVPVNPANMRRGRQSMALVAVAGVTANLLTAIVCGVLIRSERLPQNNMLYSFLLALIAISLGLAVFNLLPVFPLDGFNFAVNVLPKGLASKLAQYGHWGPGILMLLIFLPQVVPAQWWPGGHPLNLLTYILEPPLRVLERAILGA